MSNAVQTHRKMPAQKPGSSRQDYGTPRDFIAAVERRFGKLHVDLAATKANAKAPRFVTPEEDSFSLQWHDEFRNKRCWLNPPFGNIAPWAAKCASDGRNKAMGLGMIFFLTPASVGARWFAEHVHRKALVLGLVGRLVFEPETMPYPKDCCLSVFGPGVAPGFDLWDWQEDVT